jgi:hypothetical protein
MNNKPTAEIDIPKNLSTSDPIFRLLLEQVNKAIRTARTLRKDRITVRIEQGN